MADAAALVQRVLRRVVGREREVELVVAALSADRHVLLEGPPGTGKSTLLRAVADELGLGFVFVDGPLVASMRDGSLLYIEEINRIPEETLNVLITVMSERELHVPRLGRVVAEPGFRLVAAMNPFDAIGTARISSAIYDRVCRLSVDYQSAIDEEAIVTTLLDPPPDPVWLGRVVEVVRLTRTHPDVRIGSSVRGAIDIAAVAAALAPLRQSSATAFDVGLDSAIVALSGRLRLREGLSRSPESVVTELWYQVFGERELDTAGKAGA